MEDDVVFEKIDEEIFDTPEQTTQIITWLVNLLGGKVVIPVEEEFWDANYPQESRLVLRKENGILVLVAEKQTWQQV